VDGVPSESGARSHTALILALGSLRAALDEQREIGNLLSERIGPMVGPVVRLAAAMCLARASRVEPAPEFLDVLTVATGSAWSDFEGLPWCDGDVAVSVGGALAEYPQARLRFLVGLLPYLRFSVTYLAKDEAEEDALMRETAERLGRLQLQF
jgi:hypothetical protein